jgi:hypothetical protein
VAKVQPKEGIFDARRREDHVVAGLGELMTVAETRFSNALRRRPEADEGQRYLTPSYVLEPVRRLLGGVIGLDPCTEPNNPTRATVFYCPPQDGCTRSVGVLQPTIWLGEGG